MRNEDKGKPTGDRRTRRTTVGGLSGTVVLLGIVSLLNDLGSEMIYPLLPVFLASIGASMAFVGLVEGVAETTASLLKVFSGWIADRLGRKRLLTVAGYFVSNAVRPLMGLATAGWHVLFLRFTDRLGKGVRTAPRDAVIADNTSSETRGRAFGFNRAMDHAGAVGGALVAWLLMELAGASVSTVFLLSAIPAVVLMAVVGVGVGTARDPQVPGAETPRLSMKQFDSRFKRYLLALVIFTLGNSSDAFLLLRAREVGIPIEQLPLLWVVLHVLKMLASGAGGLLSDRFGRVRLIVTGWGIYALVYLGFAMASEVWQVWILFTAYGLYFGLTEGVEKAFVADLVPANLRATGFGVYAFTIGVVALPASLLAGLLWDQISSLAALGTGAALAAVASVVLWIGVRTPKARPA